MEIVAINEFLEEKKDVELDDPIFLLVVYAEGMKHALESLIKDEEKKAEWTFKLKVAEVAAKFPKAVTLDEALELLKIEATDVEEAI